MSYTFLLERGEESSAECFSDIPVSVLLRLNLTADESCSNGSETESCHDFPSGTTSEPLTEHRGEVGSMSCAVDSRARTSLQPEGEQDLMENVQGCGPKCTVSFAKWDRDTCSWKTRQRLLLGGLAEFSETWPEAGSVVNGVAYLRPALEQSTGENECGYLPTLTVVACEHPGRVRVKPGQQDCTSAAISRRDGWTTPGQYSPSHAAWFMAWPESWTSLDHLATDKFQQWLHSHGDFLEVQ